MEFCGSEQNQSRSGGPGRLQPFSSFVFETYSQSETCRHPGQTLVLTDDGRKVPIDRRHACIEGAASRKQPFLFFFFKPREQSP